MKAARLVATTALLLFVGATVGALVAQEVARSRTLVAEQGEYVLFAEEAAGPAEVPEAQLPGGEAINTVEARDEDGSAQGADVGAAGPSQLSGEGRCVIDAIYFHNSHRCSTCLKIEREAKAIVEAEFAVELASGRLRWAAIDMEQERHYVRRYDLTKPTLVLVRSVGDEPQDWVALDDTWSLIGSTTRFSMYIMDSFRGFLQGCS